MAYGDIFSLVKEFPQVCQTCKFLDGGSLRSLYGNPNECKRNAPVAGVGWPKTNSQEWCAEWQLISLRIAKDGSDVDRVEES